MTRKRYKKLLMALGLSRNVAEAAAREVAACRASYAEVMAEITNARMIEAVQALLRWWERTFPSESIGGGV